MCRHLRWIMLRNIMNQFSRLNIHCKLGDTDSRGECRNIMLETHLLHNTDASDGGTNTTSIDFSSVLQRDSEDARERPTNERGHDSSAVLRCRGVRDQLSQRQVCVTQTGELVSQSRFMYY